MIYFLPKDRGFTALFYKEKVYTKYILSIYLFFVPARLDIASGRERLNVLRGDLKHGEVTAKFRRGNAQSGHSFFRG